MTKLKREFSNILNHFSPNSEDGKSYSIGLEGNVGEEQQHCLVHVSNPYAEPGTSPLIQIKIITLDDGGTVDLHNFLISTGRSFCNCNLLKYNRHWIVDDEHSDQKMRLGSTTDTNAISPSETVELKSVNSILEDILKQLDSCQARQI